MTGDGDVLGLEQGTRVILWVEDFDASLRFYEQGLGLSQAYPSGGGWAEFTTGGSALCLHDGREAPAPEGKSTAFGWAVADLDAAVDILRGRGIRVDNPKPVTEGMRAAEFRDPSGNALFIEGP